MCNFNHFMLINARRTFEFFFSFETRINLTDQAGTDADILLNAFDPLINGLEKYISKYDLFAWSKYDTEHILPIENHIFDDIKWTPA